MLVHRQYDNPPKVVPVDASNPLVDVYDWEWNPDTRQLEPVKVGTRNLKEEIQAAKGETLTEIMAKQPGNSPAEKLSSAVSKGIVELRDEGKGVVDLTEVPDNYLDAFNLMQKGVEAYKALGIEPDPNKTPTQQAIEYYEAKLAEAKAAQSAQEGANKDVA